MRSLGHFKRHLATAVYVDNKLIKRTPVEDPFATVNTIVSPSFREWLRLLWKREICVRVHIESDGVAWGRWFQGADICEHCKRSVIGYPHDGSSAVDPGYHHGDERWCETCHYGYQAPKAEGQCSVSREP